VPGLNFVSKSNDGTITGRGSIGPYGTLQVEDATDFSVQLKQGRCQQQKDTE
jgi:hypothetical protein